MNGYKPTNNYSKALSNYESGNRSNVDRRDMLNKLLTIYSGVNNYGIGQKRTNTAKFGREVAAHYKQKGKQPWLEEIYGSETGSDAYSLFQEILGKPVVEGYAPVKDGLFGMIKNTYNPTSEFNKMHELGAHAMKHGGTNLAQEGMSKEAIDKASASTIGTAMQNPSMPYILALLGLGMGLDNKGSFLSKANKSLGI